MPDYSFNRNIHSNKKLIIHSKKYSFKKKSDYSFNENIHFLKKCRIVDPYQDTEVVGNEQPTISQSSRTSPLTRALTLMCPSSRRNSCSLGRWYWLTCLQPEENFVWKLRVLASTNNQHANPMHLMSPYHNHLLNKNTCTPD